MLNLAILIVIVTLSNIVLNNIRILLLMVYSLFIAISENGMICSAT